MLQRGIIISLFALFRVVGVLVVAFGAAGVVAGSAQADVPMVVINEVMWMGADGNSDDEWIELRNMKDEVIDITGWKIDGAGSGTKSVALNGVIDPGGFFIVTKLAADKTAISDATVIDMPASSLSLLNGGEQLVLKNADGDVVDSTPPEKWPAGKDGATRHSMERDDPPGDGFSADVWHSCEDESGNDETLWDTEGNTYGTPRVANTMRRVNGAPIAVIAGPEAVVARTTASFSAEDSTDPDDDGLKFLWDLGDGSSGSGAVVMHSFVRGGKYLVKVTVSDGELASEATLNIEVTEPEYSQTIFINEFLPDPIGDDVAGEFIELINTGSEDVDVGGWKVDDSDGGSAPYIIPSNTIVNAGKFLVLWRVDTKLALNNSADAVRLFDPAGAERSASTYSKTVPQGQSYNRMDDGRYELSTTTTPGAANEITGPDPTDNDDSTEDEEKSPTPSIKPGAVGGAQVVAAKLADLHRYTDGVFVTVDGVVSAPPDLLGKRVMYIAGSGIRVLLPLGVPPKLAIGDKVSVMGVLADYRGERQIKVAQSGDVRRIGSGAAPSPHDMATGDVEDENVGWLVRVAGEVASTSGDTFYIDDDSGQLKVYVKKDTGISKPPMKKGMEVTVIGVVSATTSGVRLMPRFQSDIVAGVLPSTVAAAKKVIAKKKTAKTPTASTAKKLPDVLAAATLLPSDNEGAVDGEQTVCAANTTCSGRTTELIFVLVVIAQLVVTAWRSNEPLLKWGGGPA